MRKQSKQNWTSKEVEKICRTPIKRGNRGDGPSQSQERKISICAGVEIPLVAKIKGCFSHSQKK